MNEMIGTCSLGLAVLVVSPATILACILAGCLDSRRLLWVARGGLCVSALLLSSASVGLLTALVDSDFSLKYVVHYTEAALPMGYKLAAFWAGQEGSILLWAWLLALMSAMAVFAHRFSRVLLDSVFVGTLALLGGFFAMLMFFAASPFALVGEAVADGQGLNPLLQNIGMIAHPPLLFMGYAGFAIPFALLMAGLAGRGKAELPLAAIRVWMVFSWLFLSIGILLGAQWAYVELGWGGYWSWDPVENASLLPWLTATALLHSLMVQQHRGMFKIWNAFLIAGTFLLCVFGTYLTRSGIVQSVHGFGVSAVGRFFLVFLAVITSGGVAAIVLRIRSLRSETVLENVLGREGAFLIGNVLLSLMMLQTLVGTVLPVVTGWFVTQPLGVSKSFYDISVVPVGLALVALMACGPLLVYGAGAGRRLGRGMAIPGIVAAISVAAMCLMRLANPWALVCTAIVAAGVAAMVIDLFGKVAERRASTGENPVVALVRLLDGNHRRYGGQLAHLGMLMIVAGIAGSSLFSVNRELQMTPGQRVQVGRYGVKFDSIDAVDGGNYRAVQLTLEMTDPDGSVHLLKPQRRFYDKGKQPSSEVAIRSSLREDLYATLAGFEYSGQQVAVQLIINPLVNWIWLGGVVLGVGGIVCLTPRILPLVDGQGRSAAVVAASSVISEDAHGAADMSGR